MASSRFPNKPMALICGMPMIEHIYKRTLFSTLLDEVYVATCDKEILDYVKSIGGNAILTKDSHERATDRSAEALSLIQKLNNKKYDLVIMIQGDEPLIMPEMIDSLIEAMKSDKSVEVVNLMQELKDRDDIENPNIVKVVKNKENIALYFSREPIPSSKNFKNKFTSYKQLGLIGFTNKSIIDFISLKPTTLEIIESIDMNRFIENHYKIKMVLTSLSSDGVDTPEDCVKANLLMENDNLYPKYKK
jgi:3-deoxy-manno-octulosonate cytidylyltransferase (CMP-KDO synthetase)